MSNHTKACFSSHMGIWMISAQFMREALAAIRMNADVVVASRKSAADSTAENPFPDVLQMTQDGIAVIGIDGPMMKGQSKYGGTSTVSVRQALRHVASDSRTKAVMLHISSPGGTAAGTEELANEIRAVRSAKPVHTHFADMGASAAYWAGSQASRVTANRSAMVGSIGTYNVLYDESEAFKADGVKVHVISTGPHKGTGVPGTKITPAQISEAQRLVDGINEVFLSEVMQSRAFNREQMTSVSDGRVWLAEDAQRLGLIDGVATFDKAMSDLRASLSDTESGRARDRHAAATIRLMDI